MEELLAPYVAGLELSPDLFRRCRVYLDLLLRWNAKTNLTAVRDPEQLVQRQLGESLYSGQLVGEGGTLLDFGSGAGFPGIPLQLLRPGLLVTLAESQGKKAAFLREAVRELGLSTEIWAARVESMAETRQFDWVAMRAVDHSEHILHEAERRVTPGGSLLRFVGREEDRAHRDWMRVADLAVPCAGRVVLLRRHANVPRGTP